MTKLPPDYLYPDEEKEEPPPANVAMPPTASTALLVLGCTLFMGFVSMLVAIVSSMSPQ